MEKVEHHGISITDNRLQGALTVYFGDGKVQNYADADASDGEAFGRFFKLMLRQGINLAPSKFEAWFLTTAHTEADIDEAIEAVGHALDRKSTRLNSSHVAISYAVFCLKKKR